MKVRESFWSSGNARGFVRRLSGDECIGEYFLTTTADTDPRNFRTARRPAVAAERIAQPEIWLAKWANRCAMSYTVYTPIRECSCERFEFEWNTKILRQLCNVSLNASSSYRPKYFVSPNFERSFCIVYATRWSLVTLLKVHLVHFCGPPGVYSNFIYIYYILTDSRVRVTVSCCSIKCFLLRMVEITIIIVTVMITIIILIITIIRVTIVM